MQENDFEKQVHQKMGELRLVPSEAVWEQVEMRLHEKDKRRRWIIWFPILLAGLVLGGYFAMNPGHSSHRKQSQASTRKATQQKITDANETAQSLETISEPKNDNKTASAQTTDSLKIIPKQLLQNTGKGPGNDIAKTNNDRIIGDDTRRAEKLTGKYRTSSANTKTSSFSGKSLVTEKIKSRHAAQPDSDPFYSLLKEEKFRRAAPREDAMVTVPVSEVRPETDAELLYQLKAVNVNTIALSDSVNTSFAPIKENNAIKIKGKQWRQSKRWEWGVSFQGGKSTPANGSLNKIFSGTSNDAFSFANLNLSAAPGTGNANGNPPTPVYLEPYPTTASAAFSAGAFLKRNFSQRFGLSIGLNYTYYSTFNKVGTKVDSNLQTSGTGNLLAFNRYFRVGSTGSYTNKYHYLELPVEIQTKLTRSWRLPLYWDLGFSFSKLLASNALHFDNTTGYYYKDNDLLNKTQLNVITGLPLTLSAGKNFELGAGPTLQYGVSDILVKEKSANKHFLFFGLKANMVLGKK